MPREELIRRIPGAAGILCTIADRIDAPLMDAAGPGLAVVSNYAVGVNNVDVAEAGRRGIRVCNTPDVLTQATADLGFALLLAAARKFSDAESALRAGKFSGWDPWGFLGVSVYGGTLGIVGMGKIGSAIAVRAGVRDAHPLLQTAGRFLRTAKEPSAPNTANSTPCSPKAISSFCASRSPRKRKG
jgi:glyoxylate reductase